MNNDKIFQKTEGRLYRFYEDQQKIKCLDLECVDLEQQKEKIRKDIQETNVFIEEESKSITYEERVQTSSNCTSYAERALINEIDKLEKEWIYVRKKLLKKRVKIRELERKNINMKNNIEMLSEENKRFIELKYGDKKSFEEIGQILNMGKTTAYRKREELINNIGIWINIIK
ncbi:hypothetical protein [Clostridium senegalense]